MPPTTTTLTHPAGGLTTDPMGIGWFQSTGEVARFQLTVARRVAAAGWVDSDHFVRGASDETVEYIYRGAVEQYHRELPLSCVGASWRDADIFAAMLLRDPVIQWVVVENREKMIPGIKWIRRVTFAGLKEAKDGFIAVRSRL